MALGALSLSTTAGVQGRPFSAAIVGLTTGRVEVLGDGSPGFATVNGRVTSPGLPYPVSTVVLREYEPGVGQGYRDSRIDVTAATRDQLQAQAAASLGAGRTLVRFRVAGERQADGALAYSLKVEDDLGATASLVVGTGPTPPVPSFSVQPSISPTSGNTGQTFTATDGAVSNGAVTGRRWLLSGTAIGTGATVVPVTAGSLVLENTATGPGGTTVATSAAVTVSSGVAAAISSINAEGWSAEWATGTPPTFTPDTSPQTISASRQGYSAAGALTTITEPVTFTRRKRQPYPNQAQDTPSTVALSTYLYSTDSIAGVTNNSSKVSPKPVLRWISLDHSTVGNSIKVEAAAYHRNGRAGRFVACVEFTATDGTNTTAPVRVSATSISTFAGDKLPVECFVATIDVSGLADNAWITVNAVAKPFVGDAASVQTTVGGTVTKGLSPRYFYRNVTRAANPPLAYVTTAGNDTTGVWSTDPAVAAANPFLTPKGATDAITAQAGVTGGRADGCRVRIGAGEFALTASTTARGSNGARFVFEPIPGTAADAAILTIAASYRPRIAGTITAPSGEAAIEFANGIVLKRTAAGTFLGESGTYGLRVYWNNAIWDQNSLANSNGGLRSATSHEYRHGLTIRNLPSGTTFFQYSSAVGELRMSRGVEVDLINGPYEHWITIGCKLTRMGVASVADPTKGYVCVRNEFRNPSNVAAPIAISSVNAGEQIVEFVEGGNLIEVTHTTLTQNALAICADAQQHGDMISPIMFGDTVTGYSTAGRRNVLYDTSTEVRYPDLAMMRGCLDTQPNVKGDVFNSDGTHIGNFAFVHGVDCQGNYGRYRPNSGNFSNELQTYPGLRSFVGTSPTVPSAASSAIWTNYQGTTDAGAAGAGGGTYTTVNGSPARGLVIDSVQSFDLAGTPLPATDAPAGAYA